MSGEKDIKNTNKELLRPIVKELSAAPHSYILEDEDASISFSFENRPGNKVDSVCNEEATLSGWKSVASLLSFYG